MVTWRAVRLVLLLLVLMGEILAIVLFYQYNLADFLPDLPTFFGEDTPIAILNPSPSPEVAAAGKMAAIPRYRPVMIMMPPESVFAPGAPAPEPSRQIQSGVVTFGNCLMNDGSIETFLPDCVIGAGNYPIPENGTRQN